MRLIHFTFSLETGGIENNLVKLVNRLEDFEHHIISLTGKGGMEARLRRPARIHFLDKGEGHDPLIYPKIYSILRDLSPGLIHTRNWGTLMEGFIPSFLAGRFGRIHGFYGLNLNELKQRGAGRRFMEPLLLRKAHRIITLSPKMARELSEGTGVREERIEVVGDGVDLEEFDRGMKRDDVREGYGIPPLSPLITNVGRLDPVKDQATLLRAFHLLLPRCPDALLVMAGEGGERARIEGMIRDLGMEGKVFLPGEVRDLPPLLRSSDLYVQSSLFEGVSNALIEAMAASLPVVATNVGGTGDVVEDGVTGLLVPPGDPGSLASAVTRILDLPGRGRGMGIQARKRVERLFSFDDVAKRHRSIYYEAAREGGIPT